jgi:GNAT superfamily N-acetyltransferase
VSQVEVRLATAHDLVAVVDAAGIIDPPPDGVDVDRDYYAHVLEHGRLTVADASGIVLGYCGTIPLHGTWFLTDLFLHQDAHGRGIGGQLLNGVWPAALVDAPRHTLSSLHPAAVPLYVRAGMRPLWPLLYVEGAAESLEPTHLATRAITPTDAARHESSWLGWDRQIQYRYWSSRPGARTMAALHGDAVVAVGVIARSRVRHTLLHLAAADPSYLADAVVALVTQVSGAVLAAVPGLSTALPLLLDAGWRVVDHDLYCASEPDLLDPARLVLHPGLA